MKKSALMASLMVILFISCTKDEPDQEVPTPTQETVFDYFPLKNGNFWVYEQKLYDSSGIEIPSSFLNDSLVVKNDTMINNMTYQIVEEYHLWGSTTPVKHFYRDSADCIVNHEGKIVFSIHSGFIYSDTIQPDTMVIIDYYFDNQSTNIVVPAGAFNCVDYKGEFYLKSDQYNTPRYFHTYYCKNTGPVKKTSTFAISLYSIVGELVNYQIQ